MDKSILDDVAIFCMADGNINSFKIKKNVATYLQGLVEGQLSEDWTVDEMAEALSKIFTN